MESRPEDCDSSKERGHVAPLSQLEWKERENIPLKPLPLKEEGGLSASGVRGLLEISHPPSHCRVMSDQVTCIVICINTIPIQSQLAQNCRHQVFQEIWTVWIRKGRRFPGEQRVSVPGAAPRTVVFKKVPAALVSRKKAPVQAPAGQSLFLQLTSQIPWGLAS